MNHDMNHDIKNDRMWTIAKDHRKPINALCEKLKAGLRMTDDDMKLARYAISLASCELSRRYLKDLNEEKRLHDFGVDTPPAE